MHNIFIIRESDGLVRVMVFDATFKNISVILWRSVLFVEETSTRKNPPTWRKSLIQTLSHNVV